MKTKITSLAVFAIVALATYAGTALADRADLTRVEQQQSTGSGLHRGDAALNADADGASVDAAVVSDHKAVEVHADADRRSRTAEATPCAAAYQISLCLPIGNAGSDNSGQDNGEPDLSLPVGVTLAI